MAPITRSSVHGRPSHMEISQEQVDHDEADDMATDSQDELAFSVDEHDSMNEDMYDNPQAQTPFQSTAQELLQPLQETANRVSRQVEEFAKCLDKFNTDRPPTEQVVWTEACMLLDKYRRITMQRLRDTTSKSPRFKPQSKNRRSLGDTDRQLQNLQLEADLWALVSNLLVCKSPVAVSDAQSAQESKLEELHRYSSNTNIWNAFLDSDIVAQEYECILDWLQETAREHSSPIETITADLVAKAERGDGIWSAGLIYTKDAIKKQKRSRVWPMPLEPDDPGLKRTHRRATDDEPLVTQMDPDAPLRQDAHLEQQDEFHELAAWQACWEMLRRGWPIDNWRVWYRDRNELWHTAVVRSSDASKDQPEDSPWLRIINLASNTEWAARCKILSEKGQGMYEDAVYGIMSGNHVASAKACQTIDDNLFSLFNALLIERFQSYVEAYRHKLKDNSSITFSAAGPAIDQVRKYLRTAQIDSKTKEEAHDAHKWVEAAIMGQEFETFFVQTGYAAAEMAHLTGQSSQLFEEASNAQKNEGASIVAQDQDSVRMVAHLQLLLRSLGFLDKAYLDHPTEMDNNIVNYMGSLERDAKYALLPLYASKLAKDKIAPVLGAILVKIIDARERDLQVKLMKQYDIPFHEVIYALCEYARYSGVVTITKLEDARHAAKVIEYKDKIVRVKANFIRDDISQEELDAIKAHEWLKFMDAKNWGMAAWCVTAMYKTFLLQGKLAAAKALSNLVPLSDTSLQAVSMNLSLATAMMDGSEHDDIDMEGSGSIDEPARLSPTRRKKETIIHPLTRDGVSREILASKSLVWAQLEQLVIAMDLLEVWQNMADEVEKLPRNDLRSMKAPKRHLANAMEQLKEAMAPLLDDDFLMIPNDEDEKFMLTLIRNHYIPECILAYNSAMYFAGHAVTRTHLVACMQLAHVVATSETLTAAFVQAGRMRELVDAFAHDSQALLRANEAGPAPGKGKQGKRQPNGPEGTCSTDIWTIQWREEANAEVEAAD